MPNIRSLTMTAPQVRALLREAEAPGSGMSRHAVPVRKQPNKECDVLVSSSISPQWEGGPPGVVFADSENWEAATCRELFWCPYAPGDMIYVRETPWAIRGDWIPSRMPRWASRLTLIVTDVQARRLREAISCAQAIAEGVPRPANELTIDCDTPDPRQSYGRMWDARHGKRYPWSSNPWVWFLFFRPIARNVDDVVAEREVA